MFAALVIGIAALAIGTTSTVFGALDSILFWKPPGVQNANTLVRIYSLTTRPESSDRASRVFSYPDYQSLRSHLLGVREVSAIGGRIVSLGLGRDARSVSASFVSHEYFSVLGVHVGRGRTFTVDENRPPYGTHVAIISHALWQSTFGSESEILGQEVLIGGREFTVVGVMPVGFTGINQVPVDVWLPLSAGGGIYHGETWDYDRGDYWLQVIARRERGWTNVAVEKALAQRMQTAASGAQQPAMSSRIALAPINLAWGPRLSVQTRVSLWLLSMAMVVLILASANVANLYLIRASARAQDTAVRLALGASTWQLATGLLTESAIVASCGGVLGMLIATVSSPVLAHLMELPSTSGHDYAWRLTAVVTLCVLVVTVLSAIAPLGMLGKLHLNRYLAAGHSRSTRGGSRIRNGLVVVQVGLATVLLIGAGLFVTSLTRVFGLDLGFDAERVTVAEVDWAEAGKSAAQVDEIVSAIAARLASESYVESVALGSAIPFASGNMLYLRLPGQRPFAELDNGTAYVNLASPEFFEVLRMRILEGRGFGPADRDGSERVAIVNREMARRLWPAGRAIGSCMQVGTPGAPCTRVIGIVENALRDNLSEAPQLQYFLPFEQGKAFIGRRAIFIRTVAPAEATLGIIRKEILATAAHLPSPTVRSLQGLVDRLTRPWKMAAGLFALFSALATVLAALGVYSVMAFAVSQRRHELSIRLALGAHPRDVALQVVRHGLALAAIGAAIGFAIAAAASRRIAPLLFDTQPFDPASLSSASVAILAAAVLASVSPAIRAMRTAPAEFLRN